MENYEFQSHLLKEKDNPKVQINEYKNLNLEQIEEKEKYDNTNQEIISAKLDLKKSNQLLLKNFDVLSKEKLNEYGIIKKFSNKESYFYFLKYIASIEIIEEGIKCGKTKKKNNTKNTNQVPNVIINISEEKINVEKKNEINYEIEEKSEFEYGNILKEKNICIDNYFIMNDKVTIKQLNKKMKLYLRKMTIMDEHKNNYPDFQSELFYHYHLQNVLETFREINEKIFIKRINMIKKLRGFINKIKNDKIKDKIILNYFYLIIDIEYELEPYIIKLINEYTENKLYKNAYVDKEKNKLIINGSNIVIENFDHYNLNDDDIENLKEGEISLDESYYSLKGYLINREFTEKEGSIFYEQFIMSNLLNDIIFNLYDIKEETWFYKLLMESFKRNTNYMPIENSGYASYTDKKLLKIYIDNDIDINDFYDELDDAIIYLIKKAFFAVNNQHEFGHGHRPLFFYISPKLYNFDSPLVEIKFDETNVVKTDEGGRLFEYLLYGRIIYEMNIKEIIYISNYNNFNKKSKQYREDFVNLKNKDVKTVFQNESKDNLEISKALEAYEQLKEEVKDRLEHELFKSGKKNPNISINLETYKFSSGKQRKCVNEERKKFI